MPVAGPYFFAWVDPGTAFDPAVHNVMDEYIFSMRRVLAEGDKPFLEIELRNPHIGVLNSSRKLWAWASRVNPFNGHIEPFFYGRVDATPTNVFAEVITLKLISWPLDYFQQFQTQAEAAKITGPYDPIFIDPVKRDDPDTILEALSKLVHIDPVTLVVSLSDIITGEDGNVVITADQHFYDGMSMEREGAPPLTVIRMDATVSWTQTARGFINLPNQIITSYSGDGIISEWPRSLQSIGSGWTIQFGAAADLLHVSSALTATITYNWTNNDKVHADGDALSTSISLTVPQLAGDSLEGVLTSKQQSGVLDPFNVDSDGDPAPLNIPPSFNATYIYCPRWEVATSLQLRYDAERPRTERVIMLLTSDLQATIVDPLVTQYGETITKSGADVGVPILKLLNWSTIAGQAVSVGDVVFPDLPTLPGEKTVQICVTAGTAGTIEPNFSDVVGVTTNDNTVVWSSLGVSALPDTAGNWTAVSHVPLGEIICPRQPLYISFGDLIYPGLIQFPPVGVSVSLGEVVGSPDSAVVCVLDGVVGGPGGETAGFAAIGQLPDGKTHYICTQAGLTGALYVIPQFGANTALHSQVTDGTVVWTSIGTMDIPAGGTVGNVWARSYLPSTRGLKSLEYLISIMRARMLYRSRAVRIGYECSWDTGKTITCRHSSTLEDTRLAGGVAVGKVIRSELSVEGDSGKELAKITMGCCVGKDGAITTVPGTSSYVNGYVNGYRYATDAVLLLSSGDTDVGYTPPIFQTGDDGLVFPLDAGQVVLFDAVRGSVAAQAGGIRSAFASLAHAAQLAALPTINLTLSNAFYRQKQIELANANSVAYQLQLNPVWREIQLKPIDSGPVFDVYQPVLTDLKVPRGINMEAASTP